jgi:hypothetical protein
MAESDRNPSRVHWIDLFFDLIAEAVRSRFEA